MVFLFVLLILIIILLNSKIRLEIKNNKAKIKIIIIGFLPVFSVKITKDKINKKINSKQKNSKSNIGFEDIIEIYKKMEIKRFFLTASIGLENIMLLTYIIPILSTTISIILAKKKVKIENQFYKINPIYNRREFNKY